MQGQIIVENNAPPTNGQPSVPNAPSVMQNLSAQSVTMQQADAFVHAASVNQHMILSRWYVEAKV